LVMLLVFCSSMIHAAAPGSLDDLCGKYRVHDLLITIAHRDGKLIFSTPIYPGEIPLTRQSETIFRNDNVPVLNIPFQIEFKKDEHGLIQSILFNFENREYTANRMVMGNWQGKFKSGPYKDRALNAKVIAYGQGKFHTAFIMDDKTRLEIPGVKNQGKTIFKGKTDLAKSYSIQAEVYDGKFMGTLKVDGAESKFTLLQVFLSSPTLGMKPPEDAIVLLPNKKTPTAEQLLKFEWVIRPHWQLDDNGAIHISGSSITTKRKFGDARIHLEFQTPFMPNDRGQARGNSGVYIQERFEVQVLDSFGLEVKDNLCGGIYKFAVPAADVCLPPLEWQTYDITFKAPRSDQNGNIIKAAVITVEHNGTIIHDNVVLDYGLQSKANLPLTGSILLQDHSMDRVSYRNMWVVPLD
jgi:3-keto-disaccharide hydrolase